MSKVADVFRRPSVLIETPAELTGQTIPIEMRSSLLIKTIQPH